MYPDASAPRIRTDSERRSPLQWYRDLPGPLPWVLLVLTVGLIGYGFSLL